MSKWWHTLATVGLAVLTVTTGPIQHAIGSHPLISTVLGSIWAILGHLLPTPAPGLLGPAQ
jgi:hypothetical protein